MAQVTIDIADVHVPRVRAMLEAQLALEEGTATAQHFKVWVSSIIRDQVLIFEQQQAADQARRAVDTLDIT